MIILLGESSKVFSLYICDKNDIDHNIKIRKIIVKNVIITLNAFVF